MLLRWVGVLRRDQHLLQVLRRLSALACTSRAASHALQLRLALSRWRVVAAGVMRSSRVGRVMAHCYLLQLRRALWRWRHCCGTSMQQQAALGRLAKGARRRSLRDAWQHWRLCSCVERYVQQLAEVAQQAQQTRLQRGVLAGWRNLTPSCLPPAITQPQAQDAQDPYEQALHDHVGLGQGRGGLSYADASTGPPSRSYAGASAPSTPGGMALPQTPAATAAGATAGAASRLDMFSPLSSPPQSRSRSLSPTRRRSARHASFASDAATAGTVGTAGGTIGCRPSSPARGGRAGSVIGAAVLDAAEAEQSAHRLTEALLQEHGVALANAVTRSQYWTTLLQRSVRGPTPYSLGSSVDLAVEAVQALVPNMSVRVYYLNRAQNFLWGRSMADIDSAETDNNAARVDKGKGADMGKGRAPRWNGLREGLREGGMEPTVDVDAGHVVLLGEGVVGRCADQLRLQIFRRRRPSPPSAPSVPSVRETPSGRGARARDTGRHFDLGYDGTDAADMYSSYAGPLSPLSEGELLPGKNASGLSMPSSRLTMIYG